MILPLSGCNQIVDVTASGIRVTIKRRKEASLTSDALKEQPSKIEVWGHIEKLVVGGYDCSASGEDYVKEETAPLFFEQSDYIVNAKSLVGVPMHFEHADKHIRESISQVEDDEPDRIGGVINFGNEVGYSNLLFFDDKGNRVLLEIEVFPSKLSYKDDYEAIRNDINEMVEAAAIDFINSTYTLGAVSSTKNTVPAIFFALINQLFDRYFKAAKVIMQMPNHRLFKEHIIVPEHKIKQTNSSSLQWIVKHPGYVDNTGSGIGVSKALGVQKRISYDTIENRLVKFMLSTTVKKLMRFRRLYLTGFKDPEKDADGEILDRIDNMVAKLSSQLKNPVFEEVSKLKGTNTMSLVFQMAPGYRDLYRYFQLIQRGISFSGEVYSLSLKETSTLYEYWCFIKLVNIFKNNKERYALLDNGDEIIKASRKGITVSLSKSASSAVKFLDLTTGDTIELVYNSGEYPSETVRQVPDNVLKIAKCTNKDNKKAYFQYVFDAKYKVEMNPDGIHYPDLKPGPKVEDINTMHRYRDAIAPHKGDHFEKLMFGAYILFPYPFTEEEYRSHRFYKSIDSVNIGGIPFLPGKTSIAEEVIARLVGESDTSAYERSILPKGIEEKLERVDWTKRNVLVGSLSSTEQWHLCRSGKYYYVPVAILPDYHQVDYVAIYQSKTLFGEHAGILFYGEVTKTDEVLRKDINDLAGHTPPDKRCYRYTVKEWKKLDSKIEFERDWVYRPRYSNDFLLKNVKSTFELFNIRSEADYRLVYELRRVQENIKVQDDSAELFVKICDTVALYNDGKTIRLYDSVKGNYSWPTEVFEKTPSLVFERIKGRIGK